MSLRWIPVLLLAATLSGCFEAVGVTATGAASSTSSGAGTASTTTTTTTATSLILSGVPAASVIAGSEYSFKPVASDAAGKPVTFAIGNCPVWATFSTATGKLSGVPTAAQEGTYSSISISVTDGTSSAALPVFSIVVTAAPASVPAAGPTIFGTPATTVVAGSSYSFLPTHTDPGGGTLSFSIGNAPSWATFDTATGQLSGTPSASNVGTTSGITISVSDGTTSATLPAFSVTVQAATTNGGATLSWTAPTTNTDGTPLTDLAGYWIYYGDSASTMTQAVQITDPSAVSYVVSSLASGTWYFEIMAYNSANVDSLASVTASKTID